MTVFYKYGILDFGTERVSEGSYIMEKFMVVSKDDEGICWATFFDKYVKAKDYMSIGECSMGYYCELYERLPIDPEDPEMGNAYVCIE